MRSILLAVARNPLKQLFPFLGGLDAHAKNFDIIRDISFGFVDKGRWKLDR